MHFESQYSFHFQKTHSRKCVSWDTKTGVYQIVTIETLSIKHLHDLMPACLHHVPPLSFIQTLCCCRSTEGQLEGGWMWYSRHGRQENRLQMQPSDILHHNGGKLTWRQHASLSLSLCLLKGGRSSHFIQHIWSI